MDRSFTALYGFNMGMKKHTEHVTQFYVINLVFIPMINPFKGSSFPKNICVRVWLRNENLQNFGKDRSIERIEQGIERHEDRLMSTSFLT